MIYTNTIKNFPRGLWKKINIRLNKTLIAIYKEASNNRGKLKIYSIETRRLLLEEFTEDCHTIQIDSFSSRRMLVLIFKSKIQIIYFESTKSLPNKFKREISINKRPEFENLIGNYLSFGLHDFSKKTTSFYVWYINCESNHILSYKYISKLERETPNGSSNNIIHNAIYIPSFIVTHVCTTSNDSNNCSISILSEEGIFLRNLIFNDHFEECLGELKFIYNNQCRFYIIRKNKEEGVYMLNINEEFYRGYDKNISKTKIVELDQFKQTSFFLQKLMCYYIINNTSISSISIGEYRIQNIYHHSLINIKQLKYYGHN